MARVFEMSTKSAKIVLHTAKGNENENGNESGYYSATAYKLIKAENTIIILKLPSRRCFTSCKPDFALSFHECSEYANLCKA